MTRRWTRGLSELYTEDPERADALMLGREAERGTRRGFLRSGALLSMNVALGVSIPFAHCFPAGLIPAAYADAADTQPIEGKDGLVVLNDRPLNAETPAHLLDDLITPAERLFVRNNGLPPDPSLAAVSGWTLEIGGESCLGPRTFSLVELQRSFPHHTYQLQLECGGNGRHEFNPPARGNQWTTGAIGCPEWTGVRLRDVLEACGIRDDAVYIGYYGADVHLSGDPRKVVISRGVPMSKALANETLLAWAINGDDLPLLHGAPLRLVAGGWPASASGKWLRRLVVRNQIHDGPKMTGQSYRVPCEPVAPGSDVPASAMCIIESMPVKSLVTFPRSGVTVPLGAPLAVRGHAWAGDLAVQGVQLSIDFGATWQQATVQPPANRLAWQQWHGRVRFPQIGYYEVWARATDSEGRSQPMILPGWNPRGYLNIACHRIAVQAV